MKTIRILVAAMVAFTWSIAFGQGIQPRPWTQEPKSFLGIEFGKPVSASIRECPTYDDSEPKLYLPSDVDYPCFEPLGDFYDVHNIDLFFDVFVYEIDGKVGEVSAGFNVHSASEVFLALREKYGTPRVNTATHLQNRMGASFQGHLASWSGTHIEVIYNSRSTTNIDEGEVTASTFAYRDMLRRDQKQKKDTVKGVL